MESPLNFNDFAYFEDLFMEMSIEINKMKAREKLTSEDLVQAF
jgi:hypothetical protein